MGKAYRVKNFNSAVQASTEIVACLATGPIGKSFGGGCVCGASSVDLRRGSEKWPGSGVARQLAHTDVTQLGGAPVPQAPFDAAEPNFEVLKSGRAALGPVGSGPRHSASMRQVVAPMFLQVLGL